MMVHDVETNPGPPKSITECLEFLVSTKREFDEDDVRLLGRLLLSFQWCSELTAGFRKRLGMKAKQGGGPGRSWKKNVRKYHGGPGRGKKGAKENPINLLQESLSDIEENQLEEILPKIAAKITEEGLCRVLVNCDREAWAKALGRTIKEEQQRFAQKNELTGLEQLSEINLEDLERRVDPVVRSFGEGFANEGIPKDRLSLTIVEVNDRLQKLLNRKYLSPLGVARNYALLKMTGSKQAINVLSRTDGSGHYDTLRQIEKEAAKTKEKTVMPADLDITADNEQVLSKNYRISGTAAERKLPCNVINNWQVSYFCNKEDIEKRGIQADPSLMPNWITTPQTAKLQDCQLFPETTLKPLTTYSKICLEEQVERQLRQLDVSETDEIDEKMRRDPVRLSGRSNAYLCKSEGCANMLPEKGAGSRSCQVCGRKRKEKISKQEAVFSRRRVNKSRSQRADFFAPFMQPGKPVALENVDHRHTRQPVIHQMAAMSGNPNSLENVRYHLRCYASFARVPRYCHHDDQYDNALDQSLEHQWFYLTTDGKPRLLILNLQENCYRCLYPKCGYNLALGYGFEALVDHLQTCHGETVTRESEPDYHSWREFDFVLSLSGRGHKEKNMISTLIEFHFPIIMEHLLESLGFVSPAQKMLIRKAKDHHKAWDFMVIIQEALQKELARVAAKEIMKRQTTNHSDSVQCSPVSSSEYLVHTNLKPQKKPELSAPVMACSPIRDSSLTSSETPAFLFVQEGQEQIIEKETWIERLSSQVHPAGIVGGSKVKK